MLVHLVFFLLAAALTFNPGESRIRGHNIINVKEDGPEDEPTQQLGVSSVIPNIHDAVEFAHFSSMVYSMKKAKDCSSFPDIFKKYVDDHQPAVFKHTNYTFKCHMIERDEEDTQVMILSKDRIADTNTDAGEGYILVVYTGTDDFRNMMTDTNIRTKPFGPENDDGTYPLSPSDDVRVHAGFNNAVFLNGQYERVKDMVNVLKASRPNHGVFTTGHSLGAADSVLMAVALKLQGNAWSQNEVITSLSFGCPKTGNRAWSEFVNSIDGLGVWRAVNGLDIVPRMPGTRFHHVGHTMQFDKDGAHAFWLHEGDKELGYRGVPFSWNTSPYVFAPVAAFDHFIGRYTRYLNKKSAKDKDYYVTYFERIDDGNGDDEDDGSGLPGIDDDDIWSSIADDYILKEEDMQAINLSAEIYLELIRETNNLFTGLSAEQIM
jgi:hypothetical protein